MYPWCNPFYTLRHFKRVCYISFLACLCSTCQQNDNFSATLHKVNTVASANMKAQFRHPAAYWLNITKQPALLYSLNACTNGNLGLPIL